MNGKKILNDVRCKKKIVNIKWSGENRVTYRGDRQNRFIANNDGLGGRKREMLPGSSMV
jgi:hypothetical protein